jgi:hypothetical protein
MLNIFKSAPVPTVEVPKQTETLVSEFIANGGEITKVTTTSRKKAKKAAKAAETAPVEATTAAPSWADYKNVAEMVIETATAIEAAPVAAPSAPVNIWGQTFSGSVDSSALDTKKKKAAAPKAAASGSAAARKAALATVDKADRLPQVIALMTRPEGASLQDIQTVY